MPRKRTPAKSPASPPRPERPQRPELPRTEPIRSWSTLFGAAAGPAAARGGVNSVQRGVELGYRVIDEYIKQGASMASSFTAPATARAPAGADLSQMTERMVKYASDFTSLWFDAMGRMMAETGVNGATNGAAPPRPAPSSAAARGGARETATPTGTQLVLHVRSRASVEVLLTLDQPAQVGENWTVEGLRRAGKDPVISQVSIDATQAAGTPLRVSVEVPDATPPGRYTGAVVEQASGQPRGRITVVVSR
jgi:hypothetical protein